MSLCFLIQVTNADKIVGTGPFGNCKQMSGTSVAAPIISGLLTLSSQVLNVGVGGESSRIYRDIYVICNNLAEIGEDRNSPVLIFMKALRALFGDCNTPTFVDDSESAAKCVCAGMNARTLDANVPLSLNFTRANPASLKQILWSGASKLGRASIWEQGAGSVDALSVIAAAKAFHPSVVPFPKEVNFTESTYWWPLSAQCIFPGKRAVKLNLTISNSFSKRSRIIRKPVIKISSINGTPTNPDGSKHWSDSWLDIQLTYDQSRKWSIFPYFGWMGMLVSVNNQANIVTNGKVAGHIEFDVETLLEGTSDILYAFHEHILKVSCQYQGKPKPECFASKSDSSRSWYVSHYEDMGGVFYRHRVKIPFEFPLCPTPPKSQRVLIDTYHSLQYPGQYVPRDNLADHVSETVTFIWTCMVRCVDRALQVDLLDWRGDHLFTNYVTLLRLFQRFGER